MNNYRPFAGITPAVKVIIILNALVFLLINTIGRKSGIDLVNILGLHLPQSEHFGLYQYVTHMFTQKGLSHLFFNMFAVFMFGRVLESVWGSKRFIIYYMVTGVGAAIFYSLINWYGYLHMQEEFYAFQNTPDPGLLAEFLRTRLGGIPDDLVTFIDGWTNRPNDQEYIKTAEAIYQNVIQGYVNIPMIGASGAVFGILLAFGMLFPNTELYLMFIPIPIKAKYFVLFYGALELYLGIQHQVGDNVAHFAHLGGMLFGFFMIRYWRKHSKRFY